MKVKISVSVDEKLLREIEDRRGREKRSTFIEAVIKKGLLEFYEKRREK